MTRRYGQSIQAQVANGRIYSFKWRGIRYCVYEVLATWHLRDRWWTHLVKKLKKSSNRAYYRLDCSGDLQPEEWDRRHSAGNTVDKSGNNVLSLGRGRAGKQSKREVWG
jgi:hypothetical protein